MIDLGLGASYPVQAILFARLLGVFQLTGSQLVSRGNFYSLMFLVLALANFTAYEILGWSLTVLSANATRFYRAEYFRNMIRQEIAFFDAAENSPGSLTSRLSSDPTAVQELIGVNSGTLLIGAANLVGSSILCFVVGWKLTAVCFFAALPPLILAGFYRVRIELGFERSASKVYAYSAQFMSEAVGAVRTVSSLTMEESIIQRYSDLLKEHSNAAVKKILLSSILFSASDSIDLLSNALAFWYVGCI